MTVSAAVANRKSARVTASAETVTGRVRLTRLRADAVNCWRPSPCANSAK
ncbi:hypothetical protein ACFQ0G_09410 [Streptomyces chiangmaiensis]